MWQRQEIQKLLRPHCVARKSGNGERLRDFRTSCIQFVLCRDRNLNDAVNPILGRGRGVQCGKSPSLPPGRPCPFRSPAPQYPNRLDCEPRSSRARIL